MSLLHLYRGPALSPAKKHALLLTTKQNVHPEIEDVGTEYCFNIETTALLSDGEIKILRWLLTETFEPENFSDKSFLTQSDAVIARSETTKQSNKVEIASPSARNDNLIIIEVGPRMNFTTAWSTNAVSVCHACGLTKITRIERSRRYILKLKKRVQGFKDSRIQADESQSLEPWDPGILESFVCLVHDRMTECLYPETLTTFETGMQPEPFSIVPLIEEGRDALKKINVGMGLGLDDWDIEYYYNLFVNEIGRNPTNVECFDLGQSNSEHSRHWFFKGRLIIDGTEVPYTLMDIIMQPLQEHPVNSVIAFKDN